MKTLFQKLPALATPRRALGMTLAVGALAMMVGGGTLAYFTTQATSTDNTFTAGTIDLAIGNTANPTRRTTQATIKSINHRPGDVVYAPLFLKNNGTLDLEYTASYKAADSGTRPPNQDGGDAHLGQFLTLQVYRLGGSNTCAAGQIDANSTALAGPSGVVLGDANGGLAGPLIGENLALNAGVQDNLCAQITFQNGGEGAENAGQGGATTFILTFDGRTP